jgi:hypothetical protein
MSWYRFVKNAHEGNCLCARSIRHYTILRNFMKRFLHSTLIVLGMVLVALLPAIAAAQQSTETVTVQVSGQTPLGTAVIGTIVLQRTCGSSTTSNVTFNGMVNGHPARFTGTVRENWLGNGKEEVEVLSTDLKGLVLGASPLRKILLVQTGANTIAVDGIPVAIDGTLVQPCGGRTSYTVTNVGQGARTIQQLPNTASTQIVDHAQWLMQPYVLSGLFIGAGALLLLVSRLLRDRSHGRQDVAAAQEL